MYSKISNSWSMVKASAEVLREDKKLAIFPVISTTGILVLSAAFIIPLFFTDVLETLSIKHLGLPEYLFLFVFYVLAYAIVIFCNSALVSCAMIRLKGGSPAISDGIQIAFRHAGSILGYAVISATVGIILRQLSERLGIFGKIFSFLADMAWNIVTFLVIPILVVEGIGPVEAIKRSSRLLKKTWGEQIIGNISISLIFGLAAILILLALMPFAVYFSLERLIPVVIMLGIAYVVICLVLIVVSSTLNTIYIAALYRYAAEGQTSRAFSANALKDSFSRK